MIHQKDGAKQSDRSDARLLFDGIIKKFPSTSRHLVGADADIDMNQTFENAVVKVQSGLEDTLTWSEKAQPKRYLLNKTDEDEEKKDDSHSKSSTLWISSLFSHTTTNIAKEYSLEHFQPSWTMKNELGNISFQKSMYFMNKLVDILALDWCSFSSDFPSRMLNSRKNLNFQCGMREKWKIHN